MGRSRRQVCVWLTAWGMVFLTASAVAAADTLRIAGAEARRGITLGERPIFTGSDSLYLNGRLLARNREYRYDPLTNRLQLLFTPADRDTLVLVYTPVPSWLRSWYGRPVPEVTASTTQPAPRPSLLSPPAAPRGGNVQLRGAKTFRFASRAISGSTFSQSLDLNISGELSPGVTVTGSVTDRGTSPAYGPANARLGEFDRVNLTVQSARLHAQLGDIVVRNRWYQPSAKAVAGVSAAVSYPGWRVGVTAARPKGRFAATRFYGRDGFQGPYLVTAEHRGAPVVPGSERVWLDGRPLERGVDKDYTIDYATGRITFSVTRPIDSRSRIEIDYELQTTDYKEELFAIGGQVNTPDSGLFLEISALREGDDRGQPLVGELSPSDRALLESAGDRDAYRSGVVPDSAGDYRLVTDSLPDSVYQYVGPGQGNYSVTFSFLGSGQGSYRFLGDRRYEYVGPGAGDYAPVVVLPRAERLDYYTARLGWRHSPLGEAALRVRLSRFDRNLWSPLDDGDNDGLYLEATAARPMNRPDGVAYALRARLRQAEFNTRERLDSAEFARDYHLPVGFRADTDERLAEGSFTYRPDGRVRLDLSAGRLVYERRYNALRGRAAMELRPDRGGRLSWSFSWEGLRSHLDSAGADGDGRVTVWESAVTWKPVDAVRLQSRLTLDRRTNGYFDTRRGTRYREWTTSLRGPAEWIRHEWYTEDTLWQEWREELTRNRLTVGSRRRFGAWSWDALLSRQWLSLPDGHETSFLGRATFSVAMPRRRLQSTWSYLLSEERRNARGLTYLPVEPGRGDYILVDGRFVPDPDGDYIQVEEILSEDARVRRGEKSFRFSREFPQALVRFISDIREELRPGGTRTAMWLLPFYSDPNQPYLFYSRRYDAELRFFRLQAFHVVNLTAREDLERRDVAGTNRERRTRRARLALKQSAGRLLFEQRLEWFATRRDSFFAGGGDAEGYVAGADVRRLLSSGELSGGVSVRWAQSADGGRSRQVVLSVGSRLDLFTRGELRISMEAYTQTFDGISGLPGFVLTGARYGTRGGEWSVSLNYGVREDLRLNFLMKGRHADTRRARITMRGEVIATF